MLQECLDGLPESSLPLQDPSQPSPARRQLHSLERQGLQRQSMERQLAQAEAALRAEQRQCEALRQQAEQSQGCAVQAQLQLRRSHSRAERLAALVNEADQERKGCDADSCAVSVHHDALLAHYTSLCSLPWAGPVSLCGAALSAKPPVQCMHILFFVSEAAILASSVKGELCYCNCTTCSDQKALVEIGTSWAGRLCRGVCCMHGAQQLTRAVT